MLTIEEDNLKEGQSRHSITTWDFLTRRQWCPDTKKRKGNDPSIINKNAAPVKKAAVGGASSLKPVVVKKETRSTAPPVKDAKADSSFFSAPKPKAKLPTFKKAAAMGLTKKEDTTPNSTSNVSQPSNFDPFQEALKSMKVAKRDSPAVSTPPPQSSSSTDNTHTQNLSANLKKKKSVTWASDGKLESIKFIERAVYDDDPTEVRIFFFLSTR
jgi:protein phosphatase 1 regulatory subunit 10